MRAPQESAAFTLIAVLVMASFLFCSCTHGREIDWERLLSAIQQAETGSEADPDAAVGDQGASLGRYQIGKLAVMDVNERLETSWTHEDMHDPEKARAVALAYLHIWGGMYRAKTGLEPTVEALARIWNGGPNGWKKDTTRRYGEKVARLYGNGRNCGSLSPQALTATVALLAFGVAFICRMGGCR